MGGGAGGGMVGVAGVDGELEAENTRRGEKGGVEEAG